MKLFFILLISTAAFAKDYQVLKLTEKGLLKLTIKATDKAHTIDVDQSYANVKVKRKISKIPKELQKTKNLKIVILGDTGCRIKDGKVKDSFQDCNNPKEWPFPQIMKHITTEDADVILHVGDFHYRESCAKGKPCERMAPVVGYSWEPWEKDFFEPAEQVLRTTPWIIVRGNHEDCDRAFMGYARGLATKDFTKKCLDYEEPEFIKLNDLMIVNVDTSGIGDAPILDTDVENKWKKYFSDINARIEKEKVKHVWIVTHKPFYGLVKLAAGVIPSNVNLQKYLADSSLKDKAELVLAGHIHLSQFIKPEEGPTQFVLGNGGTELDKFDSDALSESKLKALKLKQTSIQNPGFGYAVFTRAETEWDVQFKNESGELVSRCSLNVVSGTCSAK